VSGASVGWSNTSADTIRLRKLELPVKLIVFVTGKTKTRTEKQFTPWGVTSPIAQPYE